MRWSATRLSRTLWVRVFAAHPLAVFDVDSPFVYPDQATAVRRMNVSGVAVRAIEQAGEAAAA